jgi:hypothetical protein
MMPAGGRRSDQETSETECEEAADRHATPYTVSTDAEQAPGDTLEIIGGSDMASATGDAEVPAVLAIAVKTGKASASIVARFVEEASAVPIFPEPGAANRARPPMHHYLERLSPRGWPRVTATGSSSVSLMSAP